MNELQQKLGYQFKNESLLIQALTHRSYSAKHNERLEFLGDSVLSLGIAYRLFSLLPSASEGDLSRIRAHLVRESTLYELALELGINQYLRLGDGEMRSGGKKRPSILADALEAVIGAIYLDSGFDAANLFIGKVFKTLFEASPEKIIAWGKDAKTELQEWLQAKHFHLPSYKVVNTQGALHDQTFEVECQVDQLHISAIGKGSARRSAEQHAAEQVLCMIKQQTFGKCGQKRQ